ncbi:MAG: BBE domain-containing protein [Actinomycetota bacterium]
MAIGIPPSLTTDADGLRPHRAGPFIQKRLLKRKYDPDNFFRLNQNIAP